jgi:hypothetical protein
MARSSTNLLERMKLRRPRRPKEQVPRVGPEAQNAREASFKVAKFHGAQQRGEISAERAQGRAMVEAWVYCSDQEDGGTGERRGYWLRDGPHAASRFGRAYRIGLHLDVILAVRAEFRSLKNRAALARLSISLSCRQAR